MPVAGHAGSSQARAVPGEVVRRSRGQRAARVRGGPRRRAGHSAPPRHIFSLSLSPCFEMPAKGRWDRILGSSRRLSFSTKFRAPPRGLRAQAGARGGYNFPSITYLEPTLTCWELFPTLTPTYRTDKHMPERQSDCEIRLILVPVVQEKQVSLWARGLQRLGSWCCCSLLVAQRCGALMRLPAIVRHRASGMCPEP